MAKKCPKCKADNPDTQSFCGECGTQLEPAENAQASFTKTLETPREELNTGSIFAGRYQIIEELGKGGMGKVYKVLDKEINSKVALKLIKPEVAGDKKNIERFRSELKLARDISHKHVCRMYDLNKEKGNYYITMEYVSGEDLKSFIRRAAPLSTGRAILIAKQVCAGLTEAHRLGIVHRDLKPSNIMIDNEGNARIMDFGIARTVKGKGITGAGVMIGTPEYMSPEQVEAKDTDQRSDIYSLGIILYEMTTGQLPFEADTPFAVGVKHKSEIPKSPRELNPQIPEDLSRVILKCLEKEKENRYQSTGEIGSELTAIEKGITTTQRVEPKRIPLTSKEITVSFSPKKVLIPALALLTLLVITFVLWQVFFPKGNWIPWEERHSVAVISFENLTGDKSYDHLRKIIPNLLITSLEQSGYFQVTTWERMRDILKQMGKHDVEFIDQDLGFELSLKEGIDAIVLGSFGKAGNVFVTDVKILDAKSKKLLRSASSKGQGEGSILNSQIDQLSKEISRGIGISNQKVEAAQTKITDVTTTSTKAYNYYLQGLQADEKFYYEEARRFYEKAIEIDPQFVDVYIRLVLVYRNLDDTNAMNKALDRAIALTDKASRKEKLYIEVQYYSFRERDRDRAAQSFVQFIKEFPQEKSPHYWLGVSYYNSDKLDLAIEELNKALELDPDFPDALNMIAYTFADKGNFEKAIEYFKRYAAVLPGAANPLDSMAELYLRMGRLEDAAAKYQEALAIKPEFSSRLPLAYVYALKEDYALTKEWIDQLISMSTSPGEKADGYIWRRFYRYWLGNSDSFLEDIGKAITLADSVGNELKKARANWLLAWIYYDRGELELSRKHLKSWYDISVQRSPASKPDYSISYNFLLGLIDLKAGRVNEAKSRLGEIKSSLAKISSSKETAEFKHELLRAEIFLAEGSSEMALTACKKISLLRFPGWSDKLDPLVYNLPFIRDTRARIYKQKGKLDDAIAEYERLITFDPESADRRLIHPKYHFWLANLYEEKGWKGKAIEHYRKFLDFWQDADPGIKEVEAARKRLAGLQTRKP